jgi:hypothetical protein
MEEQALPLSYDLAPPPTSAVSKLDRRHIERLRKRDKLLTGEVGGNSSDGAKAWSSIKLFNYRTMLCERNWSSSQIYVLYVYSKIQDEALVIVELARKALVKAGMLSAPFFCFVLCKCLFKSQQIRPICNWKRLVG